jgi:hypothetical protein
VSGDPRRPRTCCGGAGARPPDCYRRRRAEASVFAVPRDASSRTPSPWHKESSYPAPPNRWYKLQACQPAATDGGPPPMSMAAPLGNFDSATPSRSWSEGVLCPSAHLVGGARRHRRSVQGVEPRRRKVRRLLGVGAVRLAGPLDLDAAEPLTHLTRTTQPAHHRTAGPPDGCSRPPPGARIAGRRRRLP